MENKNKTRVGAQADAGLDMTEKRNKDKGLPGHCKSNAGYYDLNEGTGPISQLLDFDLAISDPLQQFDELLAGKAEYMLFVIEHAKTQGGAYRDKSMRTIGRLEKEIVVLNDMYTTLDNVRRFYEEQLSYFWMKLVKDADRIKFLNDQYLSNVEYLEILHDLIIRKLAK